MIISATKNILEITKLILFYVAVRVISKKRTQVDVSDFDKRFSCRSFSALSTFFIILILICCGAPSAHAQIYSYAGSQLTLAFGDSKCPGAGAVTAIWGPNVSSVSSTGYFIQYISPYSEFVTNSTEQVTGWTIGSNLQLQGSPNIGTPYYDVAIGTMTSGDSVTLGTFATKGDETCQYQSAGPGTWSIGLPLNGKELGGHIGGGAGAGNNGGEGNTTNDPSPSIMDGGMCTTGGCTAGDPVSLGSGNMYEYFTDYGSSGQNRLTFTRYYNSLGVKATTYATSLGVNWRTNYDRYLRIPPPVSIAAGVVITPVGGAAATLTAERADGQMITFQYNNTTGVWTTDTDINLKLSRSGNIWTLTSSNDTVETYTANAAGKGVLTSIEARDGYKQTLAYNTSGQLISVTDSYGRHLSFTYTNGLLSTLTSPGGLVVSFGYNSSGYSNVNTPSTLDRLASVSYSTYPATKQSYVYEDADLVYALTGIIDENGDRFATWSYDNATGRATSTQHATGVDLTLISYNDTADTRTVTNALGEQEVYTFTTLQNVQKVTEITRTADGAVPAGTRTFTYDANGYLASSTDWDGNLTTYAHDSRGNELSRVEASGTTSARTITTTWLSTYNLPVQITEADRTTVFTYDADGNLLTKTVTVPTASREWSFTYNSFGEPLTINGPRTDVSDITKLSYDAEGDISTVTDALGHVTTISSYNADGRPLTIKDPNGLVTTLTYFARGELASRTVGTEKTSYSIDAVGNLIKLTRPDGSYLSYSYDAAHRLIGIKDTLGNAVAFTRDANGNITLSQELDPTNVVRRKQSYAYTAINQLYQSISTVTGKTSTYMYDAEGNLVSLIDPLSHATQYAYDPLNRPIQQTNALSGITQYAYDVNDHLIGVKDPRSLATLYTMDGLDNVYYVQSPDTGIVSNSFDGAGNVISAKDARGITATYTYDALNRPTKVVYSDDTSISYQYDTGTYGIGHLTSMTDATGTTSWAYDQHGRTIQKNEKIGTITLTTDYGYDAYGRLASTTYPSGKSVAYSYDSNGRISGIADSSTWLISNVTYSPFGQTTGWTEGNGASYGRTLNADGLITGITIGATTKVAGTTAIAYTYDAANRITGITETNRTPKTIAYDALNRLISFTNTTNNSSYTYDASNNRTAATYSNGSVAYTMGTTSNQLDKLTGLQAATLSYDASGNMLSDAWTYDARGRMKSVKVGNVTTSYGVNGIGERVSKSSGTTATLFSYDEQGHLLGEYSSTGAVIEETVWFNDARTGEALPTAILTGTGTSAAIHFISTDNLGSPHIITDSSGTKVWYWDPIAFGDLQPVQSFGGTTFNYNLRFPGQYYDAESGTNYNLNRDYSPTLGRYVESDPIGLNGGINTYGYVGAGPVTTSDSTGLLASPMPGPILMPMPPIFFPGTPENTQFTKNVEGLFGELTDWLNTVFSKPPCENVEKLPTGSRPINQTPWSGDHGQIKGDLGLTGTEKVYIDPEGNVWTENPDGSYVNHGPAGNFTGSGKASGQRGKDRKNNWGQ